MTYLDPALIDDETTVAEAILAALADLLPGWEASEGHVETAQAEAIAIVAATIAALIKLREREDYAGFGENVLDLSRHPAGVASTIATITLDDNSGGQIPAGFAFALTNPAGEEYGFATTTAAVVDPGEMIAYDVPVQALEAGPGPNGCVGVAIDRDTLAIVDSVEIIVAASGGSDEEPLANYVNRVADRARRVRALPITPEDHAAAALDVAWVVRALAVNRENPATPGVDAPGHVTIYAADIDGNPGSGPNLTALQAYYDAFETVRGTTVHVAAPGQVNAAVTADIRPAAGYTDTEAEDAATAAIQAALNRAAWNYDVDAPARWTPARSELSIYDVAALIDDLPQVAAVTDVTIGGGTAPIPVPATSLLRATPVTVTAAP